MVKHILFNCKCKFDSTTSNSNQKWNNNKSQCECVKYCTCKKYYACIYRNGEYLKSITDTSVIVSEEIINATDSVPKNMTNTLSANITTTV